ncbi:hypothetical protein ACN38_g5439 [Penicillium nordicum]|uniref:Uncharacterized protein n=1 Tax=Penicillium nordicum TaxID=229535 RepID=A0A0M8P8U9_9EURO|nr:hypothetical protein ACN38_g5439 [Penicillium nordicum]
MRETESRYVCRRVKHTSNIHSVQSTIERALSVWMVRSRVLPRHWESEGAWEESSGKKAHLTSIFPLTYASVVCVIFLSAY